MSKHKCNSCLHQAIVKHDSHNKQYCLMLNTPITENVKNCSVYIDINGLEEPEFFEESLDELFKNPTSRKINSLKKQISALRLWGSKNNRNKLRLDIHDKS